MTYKIIVIGFLGFTVISISDTTPVSPSSVTQEPENDMNMTTLSGVVTKSIFNDVKIVNKKPILNYEDMQKLHEFVCFTEPKVSKNVSVRVMQGRTAIRSAYNAMKEEKDSNVACNRTDEFKKSVEEYILLRKQRIKAIILNKEVMEAIIYSVCHPEEFYKNMNFNATKHPCNIMMLLFSPGAKELVGQGAISRTYSIMRNENDSEVACRNRTIDFRNAVNNYVSIQEKYNNKKNLNTQIMIQIIEFICDKHYKNFKQHESSQYVSHVEKCHKKEFGVTVNLNKKDNENNKESNQDVDILTLLFAPIPVQSATQRQRKKSYLKCLSELQDAKDLIGNFSSLIPATIPIQHNIKPRDSSGSIWKYILMVVVFVICAISVFTLLRCVKKQDTNEEFELKTHNLQEKTKTKY